jgi:hypothetical protein
VIMDASGNLYATTFFGGAYGDAAAGTGGTVWELSPNSDRTTWTYKNLYNFCALTNCADGQKPSAGVILAPSGKLYGAAEDGGVDNPACNFGPHHGCGTVFELTPSAVGTTWKYKVLYSFCAQGGTTCPDGAGPEIGLSLGGSGRLYGNAGSGGNGAGNVWELTPNAPGAAWTYKVLYSFCSQPNCTDGQFPAGASFLAGNLYGPTYTGGIQNAPGCAVTLLPSVGCGTVYELTRQGRPNDTDEHAPIWTEKVLYSFCAEGGAKCTDGVYPAAYMIRDASGRIFSTTAAGGAYNAPGCNVGINTPSVGCGTVFELSPSAGPWGQTTWTHTVLYSFCAEGGANCTDGASPFAPLIMDKRGRFYSVTFAGGAHGQGTVFELAGPPFETAR